MFRCLFTMLIYKFSLSGGLTLPLDLRSGSTGGGSALELGDDADLDGSAKEQAELSGDTGALLVLRSS